MSKKNENKLGSFLRTVSNWNWEEFCRAEYDSSYTTNESLIFSLVRACVMEKMDAIKLALNRLDGKLKTPVRIEYPKIYIVYPNAKRVDSGVSAEEEPLDLSVEAEGLHYEVMTGEPVPPPPDNDLPSLSLRQTLTKMSDFPRQVPEAVMTYALLTQQWLNGQADEPEEKPLVKSVVAAHLLMMAQQRNIGALGEVFDQIDGKLVETIQILGEDIYITSYSQIAPEAAYLNADGVLQVEATQSQNVWAEKLGNKNGG